MLDIYNFDNVFSFNPNHSYAAITVTQIQGNRKKLGGKLFVDRLFGVLGVEGGNDDDSGKNEDTRNGSKSEFLEAVRSQCLHSQIVEKDRGHPGGALLWCDCSNPLKLIFRGTETKATA